MQSTTLKNHVKRQRKFVTYKTVIEPLKEKTTFNLSLDILEQLDNAWIKLRNKLKGEHRITKTLIVERSIEMALDDLERKNEMSDLYTRLKE